MNTRSLRGAVRRVGSAATTAAITAGLLAGCGVAADPHIPAAQFTAKLDSGLAALPYGPDTCKQGYVWREARATDHVCVNPPERDKVAGENANPTANRQPGGGAYGPDTCASGFVWREAFDGDTICVTPDRRAQVKKDTAAAAARRATDTSSGSGGSSSGGGNGDSAGKNAVTVSGSASGTITDVTVDCTSSGGYLAWELKGSLNGSKVTLNYTTNNFRGAGTYSTKTITNPKGGQLTWYVNGTGKAVSNGADTGKFVIAEDLTSGSVNARISGDGNYGVQFDGPWKCS